MQHIEDWVELRSCFKSTRKILNQQTFKDFYGEVIQPGEQKISNDDLDNFIKEEAESAYHPCGTIKMGDKNDPSSILCTKNSDNLLTANGKNLRETKLTKLLIQPQKKLLAKHQKLIKKI